MRFSLSDLGLSESLDRKIKGNFKSLSQLCNSSEDYLADNVGLSVGDLRELRSRLDGVGVRLPRRNFKKARIFLKRKPGRPKGAKDKNPNSQVRSNAGRRNAWKNGNGSHREPPVKLSEGSINDKVFYLTISDEETKLYKRMWTDALEGRHEDLEAELARTMAVNYAIYKMIGMRILNRGCVDIPLYALDKNGEILRDDEDRPVLRGVKTPKGELDLFFNLQKSLGIDANDLTLTARSQSRGRGLSKTGALGDVEKAKRELDLNRKKFSKKKGEDEE